LQGRKKTEVAVIEAIKSQFGKHLKIQVNSKASAPTTPAAPIKGKSIPGIQNIVAVASGKGGVGKSTVTANLAITLAEMGFRVGILDADIYGPSMPMMFDVVYERPLAVNVGGKSKMKPVTNYGIKLLSIGFFTEPDQAVIWRGPMAAKALNQMIFDADWGTLDFLLIDLPPGTGDIHLSIMQSLPITGAAVVSTPQAVALADAKKGVAMFQQDSIQVPVLGIIENMAYFTPAELPENKYYIFGEGGAKYLAVDLEVPFLGALPLVQSVREAGDVGRPAVLQENSPVVDQFVEVTRNLVSELVKRNEQLPPTEAIKITTMAGCAAVQKT
jgi:ATP-binding protein involved in chromosome partitioning